MFFEFMLDVHRHGPYGDRTDEGFTFQINTIRPTSIPCDPAPFGPDAIEDTDSDDLEDPPTTPTVASCNLSAMGTLYGSLCVDELLDTYKDPDAGAEIFPLDSDVLPLLAESQFPGLRWDALRPVMQVASKLLESPASEEYLTYRSIFRKDSPLTAKDRKTIKRRLQQMSTHVNFSISDTPSADMQAYCLAQTAKVKGISGWRGVTSDIVLNQETYKQYCDLQPKKAKDRVQRFAFRLAHTICHELAHAFCKARFSPKIRGLGFENQCISEEGFDWETCVFGGTVSSYPNHVSVADWPCPARFDLYSRGMNPIFVARLPEHDVAVNWEVPDAYVRSLFQPSTWNRPSPPDLKVPKLLGYRQTPCAERGVCQCYDCQRTALVVQAHIECGNGELVYEKLERDTIALMRRLEQTTAPDPRILRKQAAAREEMSVASPEAASSPAIERSIPALDYNFWSEQDSEDPTNSDDDQPEEDLDQYEPYLYGDCSREPWGDYPYGRWDTRAHGASLSLDPNSYGVPKGYVSLLDGSLVRSDKADLARRWEQEDMEEDVAKAKILLSLWEKEEAEGFSRRSEKKKMRVRRLVPIVREMVESKDPAVRRMVGGIKEVKTSPSLVEAADLPDELEALRQVLL